MNIFVSINESLSTENFIDLIKEDNTLYLDVNTIISNEEELIKLISQDGISGEIKYINDVLDDVDIIYYEHKKSKYAHNIISVHNIIAGDELLDNINISDDINIYNICETFIIDNSDQEFLTMLNMYLKNNPATNKAIYYLGNPDYLKEYSYIEASCLPIKEVTEIDYCGKILKNVYK